jgi:hypothetical protein
VFVQPAEWPVGPESNRANALAALRWFQAEVLPSGLPGVLFIEDDLEVKPDRFVRAYDAAVGLDELTYFYMHDFSPRTQAYPQEDWIQELISASQYSRPERFTHSFVPEGLRLMKADAMMYGSQCIFIPSKYVGDIIDFLSGVVTYSKRIKSRPTQPFDHGLNLWRQAKGVPVYCFLPHPVQHLQDRTARGDSGRAGVYSFSFDLLSDKDVPHD